jgi:hypothetical protein
MANKQRAMVEIELDKKRTLYFNMNAMAELEDILGVPLSELQNVKMGIKAVRAFLYAGLIHEDPELTLHAVGNMVDFENLEMVQEKIAEAFALATAKN